MVSAADTSRSMQPALHGFLSLTHLRPSAYPERTVGNYLSEIIRSNHGIADPAVSARRAIAGTA
jgi:hypothetical protein